MNSPTVVDPPGCGCNECGDSQYVQLDRASARQIAHMVAGRMRNHTARELQVTVTTALPRGSESLLDGRTSRIEVRCGELSWDVTEYLGVSHAFFTQL